MKHGRIPHEHRQSGEHTFTQCGGGGLVVGPSEVDSSTGVVDREEVRGFEPRAHGDELASHKTEARDAATEVD
jgi:hypothetical protein